MKETKTVTFDDGTTREVTIDHETGEAEVRKPLSERRKDVIAEIKERHEDADSTVARTDVDFEAYEDCAELQDNGVETISVSVDLLPKVVEMVEAAPNDNGIVEITVSDELPVIFDTGNDQFTLMHRSYK